MADSIEGGAEGRLLAIGDVHGCSRALDSLLEQIKLSSKDQLVFLGDYVDRGPDSRGVIDRILELKKQFNVVALRGNHEIMMLGARTRIDLARDWLHVGGLETLESYGGQTTRDIPDSHWNFLEEDCRDYYETDDYIFVHASVESDLPLKEQTEEALFWTKFNRIRRHRTGKKIICGHTAQKTGVPLDKGFAVCIDTWVYGAGWLTCLNVREDTYWQANQEYEFRTGHL